MWQNKKSLETEIPNYFRSNGKREKTIMSKDDLNFFIKYTFKYECMVMFVCVCIYIYIYIYMCVCVYTYVLCLYNKIISPLGR